MDIRETIQAQYKSGTVPQPDQGGKPGYGMELGKSAGKPAVGNSETETSAASERDKSTKAS